MKEPQAKQADDIEASIDRFVVMLHDAPRFKGKAALFDQLTMISRNVRVLAANLRGDTKAQHIPSEDFLGPARKWVYGSRRKS